MACKLDDRKTSSQEEESMDIDIDYDESATKQTYSGNICF